MSDWDQLDLPDHLTSRDQRVRFLVFKGQNVKDLLFGLWQKGKTSQFQVKQTDHPASMIPYAKEKGLSKHSQQPG